MSFINFLMDVSRVNKRLKRIESNPVGGWCSWAAFILGLASGYLVDQIYESRPAWAPNLKMIWIFGVFIIAPFVRRSVEKIKNKNDAENVRASVWWIFFAHLYGSYGFGLLLYLI